MLLDFNAFLILNGSEIRKDGNCFEITLDGYKLYPVDQLIDMRKEKNSLVNGQVQIKEIKWANNKTTIQYELTTLKSVN